jgi:hypothetical protein
MRRVAKSVVVTHLREAGLKGRRQSRAALNAVTKILSVCLVRIADDREDPELAAE